MEDGTEEIGGMVFRPATAIVDDPPAGNEPPAAPETPAGGQQPPAEPPAQQPAATALPSTKDVFGADFDIEDWERVKTEVPAAMKAAREYKEKLQEIEQLKTLHSNPFVNESVAKLNEFLRQNPTASQHTFNYVQGLDLSQMSSIEIMVAEKLASDPAYMGAEEALRAKLARDFGVDEDADETFKRLGQIELDKKANEVRETLKKMQNIQYVPPTPQRSATPEEVAAQHTQWVEAIKPAVLRNIAGMKSISVESIDSEGKPEKAIDFALTDAELTESANRMAELFASQGIEINDQTLPSLMKTAELDARNRNFGRIVHAVRLAERNAIALQYDITLDNPAALIKKGGENIPAGSRSKTMEELINESARN